MLVLAIVAIVLGVARLAMFTGLHVVTSEYSPREHAVSDYAVGSTRRLSSAMTWTTALWWAVLGVAVLVGLPDWPDRLSVAICLFVLAAIFGVLPLVPTTLEGQKLTKVGIAHFVLAIAWFGLAYGLMGNFVRLLQPTSPTWLGVTLSALSWITLVFLVALVIALVSPRLRRLAFGTVERVFIVAVSLFYLGVAVALAIR